MRDRSFIGTHAHSNISLSQGLNFQKLSHARAQKEGIGNDRNYMKDKIWILGLGLVIFGSIFDFAALAFAAQSIVRGDA
jgi:hypothetical protein